MFISDTGADSNVVPDTLMDAIISLNPPMFARNAHH
jgi:hypothetical protein